MRSPLHLCNASAMTTQRMLGLDALRAAAILAVLASHFPFVIPMPQEAQTVLMFLGKSGVAAFFALSGFLVGGIALRTVRTPGDAWTFWTRRGYRTLPAAIAAGLLWSLAGWPGLREFAATLTFTRWLWSPMEGSWFGPYWSLAVEEWAYLLLPALVLALRISRDPLPGLITAWVALVIWREGAVWFWDLGGDMSLHTTLLRLDAICAGAVAAAAAPRLTPRMRGALALCGAMGIMWLHFAVEPDAWPQGALMPALFALTIPALAAWRPRGESLTWQVTLSIAALSYSLYLVHLPIFMHVSEWVPGPRPLVALALTWLAAMALRHWVELPFLTLRDRRPRSWPASNAAASSLGRG